MDKPLPTNNLGSPYDPIHQAPAIVGDGMSGIEARNLKEQLVHARKQTALEIVRQLEGLGQMTAASLIRNGYGLPKGE